MFILTFRNSCDDVLTHPQTPILNGASQTPARLSEDIPKRHLLFTFYWIILFLSIVSCVANTLALLVLMRQRSAYRMGSVRLNLMLLSMTEIALSVIVFLDKLNMLIEIEDLKYVSLYIYSTLVFWNVNGLICTRNWIVMIISLSRCQAIYHPMENQFSRMFSSYRLKLYTVITLIISYGFSGLRISFINAIVCENPPMISLKPNPMFQASIIRIFESYIYFVYQSCVPVFSVFAASVFMIIILLKTPQGAAVSTSMYGSSPSRAPLRATNSINSSQPATQRRATRTMLVLAITFTLLEMPTFLFRILDDWNFLSSFIKVLSFEVARFLIVTDSFCNVVIYILTSDRFRKEFCRMFQWLPGVKQEMTTYNSPTFLHMQTPPGYCQCWNGARRKCHHSTCFSREAKSRGPMLGLRSIGNSAPVRLAIQYSPHAFLSLSENQNDDSLIQVSTEEDERKNEE